LGIEKTIDVDLYPSTTSRRLSLMLAVGTDKPLIIKGTLVTPDGAPVVGKTIVVCFIKAEKPRSYTVNLEDGKPTNPSAETDEKGVFRIEIPRSLLAGYSEVAVGLVNQMGSFSPLRTELGQFIHISTDSDVADLKTITLRD